MKKDLLTFSEAARHAEVSTSSVWRWYLSGVKNRKLKSVLYGGRRYVRRQDLYEFLGADVVPNDHSIRQAVAAKKLDERGL